MTSLSGAALAALATPLSLNKCGARRTGRVKVSAVDRKKELENRALATRGARAVLRAVRACPLFARRSRQRDHRCAHRKVGLERGGEPVFPTMLE